MTFDWRAEMTETTYPYIYGLILGQDHRRKLDELAAFGHRKKSDEVRRLIDEAHTKMKERQDARQT